MAKTDVSYAKSIDLKHNGHNTIINNESDKIDWSDPSTNILINVGKFCTYTDCKTLDFLPFNCKYCSNTFCLEHRTTTSHKCAKVVDNVITKSIKDQVDQLAKPKFVRCYNSKCDKLIENTMLNLMIAQCKKCGLNRCGNCRIYHKC